MVFRLLYFAIAGTFLYSFFIKRVTVLFQKHYAVPIALFLTIISIIIPFGWILALGLVFLLPYVKQQKFSINNNKLCAKCGTMNKRGKKCHNCGNILT